MHHAQSNESFVLQGIESMPDAKIEPAQTNEYQPYLHTAGLRYDAWILPLSWTPNPNAIMLISLVAPPAIIHYRIIMPRRK